jgi:hypothetical protein
MLEELGIEDEATTVGVILPKGELQPNRRCHFLPEAVDNIISLESHIIPIHHQGVHLQSFPGHTR